MRRPKPKTLAPIRPNVGIHAAYYRRLAAEIDAMNADVTATVEALYATRPPEMAQDASPAATLADAVRALGAKWQGRFDRLSRELARYFVKAAADRTDAALKSALRKGGFTVQFRLTAAQNDIVQAAIHENVSLIKSIPSQYFTNIEGLVMRSVSAGRDLHLLSEGLRYHYGVTKRRANLISRDQNNKATSMIERGRQVELGLKATWLHSAGGKEPRPSHVANSGKEYDPKTGWYDPDEKVWCWPGTLINCRCVSKAIVPGLT